MKKYYHHSLNHARVSVYRVTQNKNFRNFLIRPELLFEEEILFVYNDIDGKEIHKVIPLTYLGPRLKKKMFFRDDEVTLKKEFGGVVYSINEQDIINY